MSASTLAAAASATRREQVLYAPEAGYRGAMSELPDKLGALKDATLAFEAAGVPYALIGGLAVGVRTGVPRATLDVDFAIPTSADRSALRERLKERGFEHSREFAHSVNFRHSSGEPLQLAFDPEFDPMIERAERMTLGGQTLYVVTKEDLITMKRRAASDPARRRSKALRDQADLAMLEGDVPAPDEGW
jgi:hypothetical protein